MRSVPGTASKGGLHSPAGGSAPKSTRRDRRRQRWESVCRRCGQCCHVRRLTPSGLHVDTSAPCRFLDHDTHLCSVYEERFRVCRDCKKLTILHAVFSPYLPEDCGYVQSYRPTRVLARALPRVVMRIFGTEGIESKALRR